MAARSAHNAKMERFSQWNCRSVKSNWPVSVISLASSATLVSANKPKHNYANRKKKRGVTVSAYFPKERLIAA